MSMYLGDSGPVLRSEFKQEKERNVAKPPTVHDGHFQVRFIRGLTRAMLYCNEMGEGCKL